MTCGPDWLGGHDETCWWRQDGSDKYGNDKTYENDNNDNNIDSIEKTSIIFKADN